MQCVLMHVYDVCMQCVCDKCAFVCAQPLRSPESSCCCMSKGAGMVEGKAGLSMPECSEAAM